MTLFIAFAEWLASRRSRAEARAQASRNRDDHEAIRSFSNPGRR